MITGVHPNASSYLQYARMGLRGQQNQIIPSFIILPPSWMKDKVLEVIDKIGKSEGGYVYYDDLLAKKFGFIG